MNIIWSFIEKKNGKIVRSKTYGSLRKMYNNEIVVVNGKPKSENGLRHLFKNTNLFVSDEYRIEKQKIIRNKHD